MQPRIRDTERLERARELRHDSNLPEQMLWVELRGRRFNGFKFRRQHPIGPYFADFYCAAANLIIELDGETHRDKAAYDAKRQAALEQSGLFVLRCTNCDFYENFDGLLEKIWSVCCERTGTKPTLSFDSPSPPAPLPEGARGAQ